MNPSSKEDWESFADLIYAELIKKQSSKPGFEKHFVSHMYKNIASTLRDVDIRKSSTMLKAYAEDKVKAEKEAKKSGGQKKVAAAKPKTVGTASAKNVYVAPFSACTARLTYSLLSALISCHSSHIHTCQCLYSIDTRACKCLSDVAVSQHPGTNPDFSLRVITTRQTATRHSTTTSTSCKALQCYSCIFIHFRLPGPRSPARPRAPRMLVRTTQTQAAICCLNCSRVTK